MIQKTKFQSKPKAFSLIQLSLVILVISITVSGMLGVIKVNVRTNNAQITRDRITAINNAITNFVAINKRLPCPASIVIANTGANFGVEAANPGTCTGGSPAAIASSGTGFNINWVYGAIPTAALGLSSDMAADGFGTKFSYYVQSPFTLKTVGLAATGFETTKGTVQGTTVAPTTLFAIRDNGSVLAGVYALYVVVSHGPDKLGGFNFTSTTQNRASADADEILNSYKAAGTPTVGATYVTNSTSTAYDDITSYRTKSQLISNAGLQFIICANSESNYTPANNSGVTVHAMTWPSTTYNVSVNNNSGTCTSYTSGGNIPRFCGQYGVWQAPPNCKT